MDKQIVVRCSRHQYDIIEKVALETELTKSELVRQLINQFGQRRVEAMSRPQMKKSYSIDIKETKTKSVLVSADSTEEAQAKAIDHKWITSVLDKSSLLEVVSLPVEVVDEVIKSDDDFLGTSFAGVHPTTTLAGKKIQIMYKGKARKEIIRTLYPRSNWWAVRYKGQYYPAYLTEQNLYNINLEDTRTTEGWWNQRRYLRG